MMKLTHCLLAAIVIPSAVLATGTDDHSHDEKKFSVGAPASGSPDRHVEVSMQDTMRFHFSPDLDTLRHGETIEFIVSNDGAVRHEFSIGNAEDQAKHAEMMRKMPDMVHEDPNTVTLAPGETARLTWRFAGDDTVIFACNIPGHFEAGMKHDLPITTADND